MTNHQFFHVEGTRVISDIFPSYHSRPEDPHQTAEALNRMYNTEYTAALTEPGSNANFIPPDKALKIAFHFNRPPELDRAKENVITWIDQMNAGTRQILIIHMETLSNIATLNQDDRKMSSYILKHV